MPDLNLIPQDGNYYLNSREVAEIIGKRHHHLLRNISGYISKICNSTETNFGFSDFFVESTYEDSTGRELPCYLISKMGCEVVANKLTGEKGTLFTVNYVARFNAMEKAKSNKLKYRLALAEQRLVVPQPRLGEINACARIVVRAMLRYGVSQLNMLKYLHNLYASMGIEVLDNDFEDLPITTLLHRLHRSWVSSLLMTNLMLRRFQQSSMRT